MPRYQQKTTLSDAQIAFIDALAATRNCSTSSAIALCVATVMESHGWGTPKPEALPSAPTPTEAPEWQATDGTIKREYQLARIEDAMWIVRKSDGALMHKLI